LLSHAFNELRHRDPLLFWIGSAMLLTLVVVLLISIGDSRLMLNDPMQEGPAVTLSLYVPDADATFAPVLKKEDGLIDWSSSAFAIERGRQFRCNCGAICGIGGIGEDGRATHPAILPPMANGSARASLGRRTQPSG